MILTEPSASLAVPVEAALHVACVQEKEAYVEASDRERSSSVQVNVASEGACAATPGQPEEVGGMADGALLDTFPTAQVEAGRVEVGQSQDLVAGSLRQGCGLVVQWGALGIMWAHHKGIGVVWRAFHLAGWRWELEASVVLPGVEVQGAMSSSEGYQGLARLPPVACYKVQEDWVHPALS